MHPLTFRPLLKQYLWGGRRLGSLLGKPIGGDSDYAESWEVVDHGADQSVVAAGPLAGKTLSQLVNDHGAELFGKHRDIRGEPRRQFPLLFKFLDAQRTLSVQVHPNDEQGSLLDPPDLGKTEAWIVLAAEPGSKIYSGLKAGVDRPALAAAIEAGESDRCLHAFEPKVGDCVFIPAGTVHALGEGLVIAEIQQASNTTFRLFDWNRVGKDGQPRPLHIEESLEVTDYDRGPVAPRTPEPVAADVERLVACDKFVLDRRRVSSQASAIGGDGRFHLVAVIAGGAELLCGGDVTALPLGTTALAPASAGAVELASPTGATVLDMYLP
ncbi:MAG: type I phosphomannose isomerase catalytic subunit [Planctomycetota bacterium]